MSDKREAILKFLLNFWTDRKDVEQTGAHDSRSLISEVTLSEWGSEGREFKSHPDPFSQTQLLCFQCFTARSTEKGPPRKPNDKR
jgi:hypothetical protein